MSNLANSIKIYHPEKITSVLAPGILAVTLYFYTQGFDPFNTPKQIILLVLAAWLAGFVVEKFLKTRFNYRKIESQILVISGFFLLSLCLGLVFSENFLRGFIGETQRRNGFLTYLSLVIVMLYVAISCSMKNVIGIIKLAVATGLIMSTYGLAQINGKDFVRWDNPYNSMISTTGNPNFASALIAIFILLSLLSALSGVIKGKFVFLNYVVVVVGFFVIIKSNSRQGLLVVFFGVLSFLLIWLILESNSWVRKFRVLIVFALSTLSLIVVAGMLNHGPAGALLYKQSVSVRGYYWRAAIEMFQQLPLVGVGLDNYGDYFKQYRELNYSLTHGFEITSTNAHNLFLQFFATGGIFLGFSYLVLVSYVLVIGIKSAKKSLGRDRLLVLTLLAAWLGFQAQSIISIDNIAISIWGWVLSGLILSISIEKQSTKAQVKNGNKQKINHISLFPTITSILILIPALVVSSALLRAEVSALKIRYLMSTSNQTTPNLLEDESEKLFNGLFVDQNYKFEAANALVSKGSIEEGLNEIKKLNVSNPRNLDILRWLASYYNAINDLVRAKEYRLKIAQYDPWNLENYLELGVLEKQLGDTGSVKFYKEKILRLAPMHEVAVRARERL